MAASSSFLVTSTKMATMLSTWTRCNELWTDPTAGCEESFTVCAQAMPLAIQAYRQMRTKILVQRSVPDGLCGRVLEGLV